MKFYRAMLGLVFVIASPHAFSQNDRPNILLIVADDLGYTDVGAYGGEIRTPNLDDLASRSLQFTNFHVLPMCAPTRAMLLSGTDHHVAGLGTMHGDEYLVGVEGHPGYEMYLHERVATLPEILADAGYHTYMAGKWHLGSAQGQWPSDRGFERSFALLAGAGSHFQMAPRQYVEDGEWVEAQVEDFYSTRTHTDKLMGFISENHDDDRPFFAFAAYTSPHWPLQAPPEFIDRYQGEYDAGYDAIRKQRVVRARQLGVVPDLDVDDDFDRVGPAWSELDADSRRHYARRMEIYAAMVENLDHHIGRLIDHLESLGELDNTVILFMSDNGAESDEMDLNPTFASIISSRGLDNSLENLGKADSFVSYGPGWAQAGSGPFNRFKGFVNEGGTRVPAFIVHAGGVNPADLHGQYLSAIDIAPTLIELAGAELPGTTFRGRDVASMTGRSFASILEGDTSLVYEPDHSFASELHGGRSVRRGRHKLVWEQPASNVWWGYPIPDTWYRWRLFDLEADPGEAHDISGQFPLLVQEMIEDWDEYADSFGVVRDVRIRDFERWQTPP